MNATATQTNSLFMRICSEIGDCLNRLRVIPRLIVAGYGFLIWDVVQWFKDLPEPTTQQSALITTLVGVSVAVFGFYMQGGITQKKTA